ncbi:MAG: hypothetical protein Q8M02_07630 [Candidatus Didemnitutus sp.]|nr:hypothetical protein [Candidatus Didemnitutus sp.]
MMRLLLLLWCGLAWSTTAHADWTWRGRTQASWQDNVTNADRPSDRLSSWQWETDVVAAQRHHFRGNQSLATELHATLSLWPEFNGLDRLATGATIAWSHKLGLGPDAWVIRAAASGEWVHAREATRSGLGGRSGFELQRHWGATAHFTLGGEVVRFNARGRAFDHTGREVYGRVRLQHGAYWHSLIELRYRHGDVVSYTTPPRPDLVQAGKSLTLVDTFRRDVPLLAYYFPANTPSAAWTLTRQLTTQTALFFHAEYRDTTHGALRYSNHRTGLGLATRF